VPLDHFVGGPETTDVTFALKRHTADGPAKGVFVTVTGGPGTSGISSAVSYADAFAPAIRRDFDLVFLDQRGARLSGAIDCPQASLDWYLDNSDPEQSTPTTGLGAAASRFVDDCVAEGDLDPARLPYYATRQAVEDLEAFRIWLGAERLDLYGESYGTQFVQQYAAAHADRVGSLIVDGPVDLTRGAADYYEEQVQGFDESLAAVLFDCSTQTACARDVAQGDAVVAWNALEAQLRDGGTISYPFVRADGTVEQRELNAAHLVNAASAYLYEEFDRMLLQRAVAAASHGNLWYLSRLLYAGLGQKPESLEPDPDPSWSDALFYAVECMDYGEGEGTPGERADAWLTQGHERGVNDQPMGSLFYGDLPCAYWPAQPVTSERPAPLLDVPYPMLVLGATLDPATPWANAERIFERAGDNARLIVKPGGAHIIFGRGDACPDRLVTDFLVRDRLPAARRTVCAGDLVDDYVPIPPQRAEDYAGTRAALRSADDEIRYSADYWAWDGEDPLATGCPFGGSIRYQPTDAGYDLRLDGCAWSDGLPLTGTGTIDSDTDAVTLTVRSGDGRPVRYQRDGNNRITVRGELPQFARE
jgi:pimeloyl-ACP methyl ester carboxylesterase